MANPTTHKLHFTTPEVLYCVDLLTEKTEWGKPLPQGCDRLAAAPDGKTLFVPSFEKDIWNVADAATGKVLTAIETKSGAHNTICGLDGKRAYLAGLKSPAPLRRGHEDSRRCRQDRTVRGGDSTVYGQRGSITLLRQCQRPPRFRDWRPDDREEAPSHRSSRVQEGPGEATRLPESRNRHDTAREGNLDLGCLQPARPRLRRYQMPPKYVRA